MRCALNWVLGGGGLLAVFVAGVLLSNGRYRIGRFEQQALGRVMHPLNTAAEITVLLLLGLLVKPAALLTELPLGLAVSMTEELPHLRDGAPALAEPLGAQLLALLFVVVLADLLLQPLLLRCLLSLSPEPSPS